MIINQNDDNKYPLISVIVPVYNVERYLRRCVDSILAQTYPNIEIIIVNDGSPDNSWAICQEYEKTQPSVRALKKPNGGLSSARNFGLNSARGEYVGFVDSDDWIDKDMYAHLYSLIKENQADCAQCDYMLAYRDDDRAVVRKPDIKMLDNRNSILQYYMTTTTTTTGSYSVCRCLFSKKLAMKYQFREGKVNEDIDYKYKVLADCQKLVISNFIGYYYYQSGDSTSSGILKPKDFDLYEAADELCRLTQDESYGNIRFLGQVKKARTPFSLLCRIAYYGISDKFDDPKAVIHKLLAEHRQNLKTLLKAPLPLSRKAMAVLLALNFSLTKGIVSLAKRI